MKSFNTKNRYKNQGMLRGGYTRTGYDWWWHSFTGYSEVTGEERQFFIEFFTCNPGLGASKPRFGQTEEHQTYGIRPSYLMIKAGTWGKDKCQLHRFFSWRSVNLKEDAPFRVAAANCELTDVFTRGSVEVTEAEEHPEWMSDNGSLSWRLKMDKQVAFNAGYGTGWLLRTLKVFEMYWHAEGMKTAFEGEVIFNGERFIVSPETSCGYADKNWGRDYTSPWVWLSSNSLKSRLTGKVLEDSVFNLGGGRPKVCGISLGRKLLGGFWYEGKPYEFNFSKFWTGTKTKFDCRETETEVIWKVELETKTAVLIADVTCIKADMLLLNYESPDGRRLHDRLWNGGNGTGRIQLFEKQNGQRVLIDDIDADRIGCEFGEYASQREKKK